MRILLLLLDPTTFVFERFTMSATDTYVRARIDTTTKERAADALAAMGLSISDAIRLLMLRIADEGRLPFEVKVPNMTAIPALMYRGQ